MLFCKGLKIAAVVFDVVNVNQSHKKLHQLSSVGTNKKMPTKLEANAGI